MTSILSDWDILERCGTDAKSSENENNQRQPEGPPKKKRKLCKVQQSAITENAEVKVHVVVEKFLYRKESDAWVRGVYKSLDAAIRKRDELFEEGAEWMPQRYGDSWEIETLNGGLVKQVTNGEQWYVFEIVSEPLQ